MAMRVRPSSVRRATTGTCTGCCRLFSAAASTPVHQQAHVAAGSSAAARSSTFIPKQVDRHAGGSAIPWRRSAGHPPAAGSAVNGSAGMSLPSHVPSSAAAWPIPAAFAVPAWEHQQHDHLFARERTTHATPPVAQPAPAAPASSRPSVSPLPALRAALRQLSPRATRVQMRQVKCEVPRSAFKAKEGVFDEKKALKPYAAWKHIKVSIEHPASSASLSGNPWDASSAASTVAPPHPLLVFRIPYRFAAKYRAVLDASTSSPSERAEAELAREIFQAMDSVAEMTPIAAAPAGVGAPGGGKGVRHKPWLDQCDVEEELFFDDDASDDDHPYSLIDWDEAELEHLVEQYALTTLAEDAEKLGCHPLDLFEDTSGAAVLTGHEEPPADGTTIEDEADLLAPTEEIDSSRLPATGGSPSAHGHTSSGVSISAFARQLVSEKLSVQRALADYEEQIANMTQLGRLHQMKPAQKLMLGWYTPMTRTLELMLDPRAKTNELKRFAHHFSPLTPPEIAVLTMHVLVGLVLHSPNGVMYSIAAEQIGKAIRAEVTSARNKQRAQAMRRQKEKDRQQKEKMDKMEAMAAEPAGGLQGHGAGPIVNAAGIVQPGVGLTQAHQVNAAASFHMGQGHSAASSSSAGHPPPAAAKEELMDRVSQIKVGSVLMTLFSKLAGLPSELVRTPVPVSARTMRHHMTAAHAQENERRGAHKGKEMTTTPTTTTDQWSHGHDGAMGTAPVGGEASTTTGLADGGAADQEMATTTRQSPTDQKASSVSNPASSSSFVPAFFHFYLYESENLAQEGAHGRSGGRTQVYGMIRADVRVVNLVTSDPSVLKALLPKLNPMLVPPKKWTSFETGGFLTIRHKIVRAAQGSVLQADATRDADLQPILQTLNGMGAVPWRINMDIYPVVTQLYQGEGGGIADLPLLKDKPLPPVPKDRHAQAEWKEYERVKTENRNLFSLRCELQYKLSAVRSYRNAPLYYPYFLDFRGRAYPIPPYLNHTGGDLSRGFLKFHEKRPLGERGLYWLMVHTATLYGGGVDKRSFADRQAWTASQIGEMAKCASDPLKQRWWLTAEKPFQFLAALHEVVRATHSGHPAAYLSDLPIHTDGSCNGLQHYAALGRDKWGGTCVNLVKSEKPQDVYAQVLTIVLEKLRATASESTTDPKSVLAAQLLSLRLTRKVVKQAVMTSVYGVTLIGARDQILARLEEMPEAVAMFGSGGGGGSGGSLSPASLASASSARINEASMYLAQLTLASLYDAFSGARRIQTWLGDSAMRMTAVEQPVSWLSPIGLPIIQPYRAQQNHTVQTSMQSVTLTSSNDNLPVSSNRQKSAFPPNFIHSLDASHMMLTAHACQREGITFASVHDSFWTHAGTMDRLSRLLREEFVHLYKQPILEQTRDRWVRRYPEIPFAPVPHVGDLDIEEVLHSPYFFN